MNVIQSEAMLTNLLRDDFSFTASVYVSSVVVTISASQSSKKARMVRPIVLTGQYVGTVILTTSEDDPSELMRVMTTSTSSDEAK